MQMQTGRPISVGGASLRGLAWAVPVESQTAMRCACWRATRHMELRYMYLVYERLASILPCIPIPHHSHSLRVPRRARSTEETTPNLHCDVHFGDEKSQTTSPRDTPAPLGRAGAFVVFASRHLLPSLAPSLADGRVRTAGGRVTRQARRGIKWEAYIDR